MKPPESEPVGGGTAQTEPEPKALVRCAEWVADRRTIKTLRKSLKDLVSACEQSISALDAEMKKPSTPERGGRVAKITNFLELQKDMSKRFGLGDVSRPKKPRSATASAELPPPSGSASTQGAVGG